MPATRKASAAALGLAPTRRPGRPPRSRFAALEGEEVALLATLLDGARDGTTAQLLHVELLLELARRRGDS